MGLPGHRRTSSDKRKRSAHFGITAKSATKCPKCQKVILPHRACAFCGTYRGRVVLDVTKRDRRATRKSTKK